ncbi:MAG: endopeptidase La [Candidatus Cloacimonetes bacterium]|nr:endopeptidase La [Candidatus Cloacimonadota bacterium]
MAEQNLKNVDNPIDKDSTNELVVVSDILPDKLTIIPILHRPVFPGIMIPLTFTGRSFIKIIEKAYKNKKRMIGIVFIKEQNKGDIWESELYSIGTVMKIFKISYIENDVMHVVLQGLQRFTKVRTAWKKPNLTWKVKYHYEANLKPTDELKAYTLAVMSSLKELLSINQIVQEQLKLIFSQISYENPAILLDLAASMLNSDPHKLQNLLEAFDLIKRSEKLLILLKEEIELSYLQADIEQQIEDKMSKQQKEFFLREQLKIIKKELGLEKDDKTAEIEKYQKRIKKFTLTKEASDVISDEIEKLKILEPGSAEFNVTRTYLNVLTELPWGIYSEERIDIKKVRTILNEDHYGLDEVKNTILQFISTIIKRGTVTGSILCLVGPPGVGKTSVGRSIARALNRKFYRFSLGGMRDEAEIKGHRRTYIGAMPGKILQSLKRTGTANPVIMLDEIDKVGKSYNGDPASALLEVLDPEENRDFLDHYLDVRFDLSKILFITTANQLDTIPRPLLDRMEIIRISGYIQNEKVEIAKRFLIPRQLKQHGLLKKELKIRDKALQLITDQYAREAGVRNLENQLKKIMRQVTLKIVEGNQKSFSVSSRNLKEFLGNPIFTTEKLYQKAIPGVTLGLAWTSLGGTTLYIESSAIKGRSIGFKQTGQLGKVMLESSEIAFSFVRSLLCCQEKYKNYFSEHFIHLHVPAGATPKDGPSAGITMALALYSLATEKTVRKEIAMTGELTLTGKVLPIGGLKEKTLAARRVGVFELIFPLDNKYDFDELPDYLKEGIKVHFVDYFKDVLDVVY